MLMCSLTASASLWDPKIGDQSLILSLIDDLSVNNVHGSESSSLTLMGAAEESSSGRSTMKSAKICPLTDILGLYFMSAGFQANMSRLRLSNSHNSFCPSSIRMKHIAIVYSGYFERISTLILSSAAWVIAKGCAFSPEIIVHSSGIILLLRNVSIPP
nr:hypothetical protein [Tanacetum cinerariifolium]